MKGWDYMRQNPDDAAKIVLDNDASGAQTEKHQKRMTGEIAKLLDTAEGKLDPADFDRTVATLLSSGGIRPGDHQEAGRRLVSHGRRRARCKQYRRSSPSSGEERPIVQQSRTIKGDPSWPFSFAAEPL